MNENVKDRIEFPQNTIARTGAPSGIGPGIFNNKRTEHLRAGLHEVNAHAHGLWKFGQSRQGGGTMTSRNHRGPARGEQEENFVKKGADQFQRHVDRRPETLRQVVGESIPPTQRQLFAPFLDGLAG